MHSQTLRLRDGRALGYAEWGDSDGKPLFLFGGSNSARFQRHPDEHLLTEREFHLYTFDRPGMGLSDRQPGRTLLNWAEDLRDFARQKQIERFAIIAASQGGPYGAACAYALPDLLSSVTLVSAVSPLSDPEIMATQNRFIRLNLLLARRAPGLLAFQFNAMNAMLRGDRAPKLIRRMFSNLPPGDQQVMDISGFVDILVQDMREGMRQGGWGGVDDMRAVACDWGFDLQDIKTEVFLWQGEADPNVTPAMGHYLAARIPDCHATFVPDAGHLLFYSCWRDILTQISDAA